jgi:hypothetical protein
MSHKPYYVYCLSRPSKYSLPLDFFSPPVSGSLNCLMESILTLNGFSFFLIVVVEERTVIFPTDWLDIIFLFDYHDIDIKFSLINHDI